MSQPNDPLVESEVIAMVSEPEPWRLVLTLSIAGFISGLVLATVYLLTLPMIEANKAAALKAAIFKVIPSCHSYKALELDHGELIERIEGDASSPATAKKPGIFAGYDEAGDFLAMAIPHAEPGFQDVIGALFGFDPRSAKIIGFEVLESKETPGLGDKIIKDKSFTEALKSLLVDPEIFAAKPGKKTSANQVETITGATISSKAVIRLLNKGVRKWRKPIEKWLHRSQGND
jgi:Na+-translocating ferredoxin:NAD+ oxidoreductase subunit G